MRKLFYLLSLLVVSSMLLAACGGGTTPTKEPAAPAEPASPAAPSEPAAPAEPAPSALKSKDPTTLVIASFGGPETLDPALAYETAGGEIIQNVYETLVFYDGEATDKFVPQLAESWEVSADGTVYTFKIRSGVKFHDGADLTASDVAYSFQRGLLFGGYSGPQWLLAEPFFGIGVDDISIVVDGEGACADDRECLSALPAEQLVAACEKVKSAIVADDAAGTVTMTLAQPWGPFIATIAQGWGSVLDQDWAVSNGAWDGSCDTWQNFYAEPSETDPLTTIMNGTGPFKLESWTQGEELVLVRNDNYWREPAKLERIVIKYIDEWGTRFAMLQTGDADIVAVPSENRSQVDAMVGSMRVFDLAANTYGPEVEVCGYDPSKQGVEKFIPCEAGQTSSNPIRLYIGRPSLASQDLFMTFQIAEGSNYVGSGKLDGNGIPLDFFSDLHIRKAFAYCFDWETYISDVFDGEAVQQPVLARQGMPGYQADAPVYTHDLAKCEEEFKLADLDKDGIPAGEDPEGDVWTTGFRLQALYNQGNTSRQVVSQILSSNVAEVNDKFVIETVGLPWPTFLRTIRAKQSPYFVSGWLEDIHDPHNWYQPYMVGTYASRQNMPAELKAQFQDILNRGVAATDPAERQKIYEEANKLFYEQVPTILLATATSHGFDQRWVKGRLLNPIFSGDYFYTMYKE
ncbi:MAG: ABC transporter substrate-binding protein [Chloroflexota bacterium]|nr:ABC transporter substrate-binding protein [Chloroflexota bacterium]MBI5702222.1 ABC transporter substrate-binding protein [Chloroflexota bacterium]